MNKTCMNIKATHNALFFFFNSSLRHLTVVYVNSLYTEESDKEIHSHLNYLLQLWRKSLIRQTSLKESMSYLSSLTFLT